MWNEILKAVIPFIEDLQDIDFSLIDKINLHLARCKKGVLERDYSEKEKRDIVNAISHENQLDKLTKDEITLYRNFALELDERNAPEGLKAVGYGSYGGDGIFECDYELSEKCMLKLMEIVDKMPEKGFYANTLGYIYYYGRVGDAPNYEKAHLYFSFGAACGVYESICKLSDIYLNGYYGIKSAECAKKLLYDIYDELFDKFVCGNYSCEYADVALRLGKIIMSAMTIFPLSTITLLRAYVKRSLLFPYETNSETTA